MTSIILRAMFVDDADMDRTLLAHMAKGCSSGPCGEK